ncbi:hypothetical protein KKA85_07020, partial [bacterium]|nr:hypothetical protein [bacterium]
MARHGTFKYAVPGLICIFLLAAALSVPATSFAQEETAEGPNVEGIMATSDSLGFATSAADSG